MRQAEDVDVQSLLDGDVIDLGAPGPDPVFGRGLIGASRLEAGSGEYTR
jgi:hypothetical protein